MAGAQVQLNLGDCETCEVTISQPIPENEIILEAYELLPRNYDGFTGSKIIRLDEVREVFSMLGASPKRFDDLYMRLMYFHQELLDGVHRNKRGPRSDKKSDFGDVDVD
jgi:hypothetical protein